MRKKTERLLFDLISPFGCEHVVNQKTYDEGGEGGGGNQKSLAVPSLVRLVKHS